MRESKQRNSPLTGLRSGLALAALAMMTALVLGGCGGSSGPVVQIPADPQAASKAELQALSALPHAAARPPATLRASAKAPLRRDVAVQP